MFEMSKHPAAPTRRSALAAAVLAGGLVLTGCTGDGTDPGTPTSEATATPTPDTSGSATPGSAPGSGGSMMGGSGMGGRHGNSPGANVSTDTMFVQMMIPHHEQAVQMSDILLSKSGIDTPVMDLANKIKAAQGPEIEQMKSWLAEWGEPTMPAGRGGQMRGMMGQGDLAALEAAEGDEAVRVFLTHMITHHQGAIQMAEREVAHGSNQDVVDLAAKMAADQKAEIEVMAKLLAGYR